MKYKLDNIIAYTLGVSDDVTKRPHPMDEIGQGQKREGALLASIIQEV